MNAYHAEDSLTLWSGGEFDCSEKVGLQIKTTSEYFVELEPEMINTHPFEIPELIAVPRVDSLLSNLNWFKQQTKKELND